MFKTAMRFVWGKKKNSFWLWLIIVFSLALILSIVPMFDAARENIFAMYAAQYGAHHGILWDLNAERVQRLEETITVSQIGYLRNFGLWQTGHGEQFITLGNMDDTALALGHIRTIEGRMPAAADEIAIEKLAIYRLPAGTQVGDTLQLTQGDVTKTYTLVGILADYSGNWDVTDSLRTGYNDYPNALVLQEGMEQYQTILGALITSHTYSSIDGIHALETEIWQEEYRRYSWNCVNNFKLHYTTDIEVLRPFDQFKQMFSLVIILGACLTVYTTIALYIQSFRESYQKLYILGASNKTTVIVFLLQCSVVILLALPAALGSACVFAWAATCISGGAPVDIFASGNFYYPGIVLFSMLFCMAIVFRAMIFPLANKSLSQMKREKAPKSQQLTDKLALFMMRSFWRSNFAGVVAILVVAGMLVASFCTAQVFVQDLNTMDPFKPDFGAYAGWTTAYGIPPMHIATWQTERMPLRQAEALRKLPGIRVMTTTAYTAFACTFVQGEDDPYWVYYREDEVNESIEGFDTDHVPDMPQDYTAVGWCEGRGSVVLIDENNAQQILECFPDLPLEQMRREGSIALSLPPIQGGAAPMHNTYYQAGDTMEFGRLTFDVEHVLFDDLEYQPEKIKLEQFSLPIAYVSENMAREESIFSENGLSESDVPTILIARETAEQSRLILGLAQVEIYLEEGVTKEEYAAIHDAFVRLTISAPGATVYIHQEEQAQKKDLLRVIHASLFILLAVFGGFVLASIYATLYMTILRKKRSLAIYRALGTPRRKLTLAVWLELCSYWAVLMVFAAVISLFLFELLWGLPMLPQLGAPLARVLCIAALVGIPVCGVITYMLLRNIYKDSVYSAMRFGE